METVLLEPAASEKEVEPKKCEPMPFAMRFAEPVENSRWPAQAYTPTVIPTNDWADMITDS